MFLDLLMSSGVVGRCFSIVLFCFRIGPNVPKVSEIPLVLRQGPQGLPVSELVLVRAFLESQSRHKRPHQSA